MQNRLVPGVVMAMGGLLAAAGIVNFAFGTEPDYAHLADHLFWIDMICGLKTGKDRRECYPEAAGRERSNTLLELLTQHDYRQIHAYYYYVTRWNNKGWPITQEDAAHAAANVEYMSCDVPHPSDVTASHISGRTYRVEWELVESGCVDDLAIEEYEFCYDVPFLRHYRYVMVWSNCFRVPDEPFTVTLPSYIGGSHGMLIPTSMRVIPDNIINAEQFYPRRYYN